MTQPPQQPGSFGQDPYGQYPHNQQGQQPGQFGQPGQPQQPGGYPQGGAEQPQWGTPAQGFNPQQQPYGQWDGTQGGQQGYPGYPGGQPPKNKTGLIVGLVVLGVLVVGGIVALILVLTNKDDDSGNTAGGTPSASSKPSSARPSSRPSSRPSASVPNPGGTGSSQDLGTGTAAQASPEALTDFLATAYTSADKQAVVNAFCAGAPVRDSKFLPVSGIQASSGPPSNHGANAQLNVRMSGSNTGTMVFQARQANGAWCLDTILDFESAANR